jgi:hypothetical protein
MAALFDLTKQRGKNTARQELIVNSRYSKRVLKSQQICSIRENRSKLEGLLTDAQKNIGSTFYHLVMPWKLFLIVFKM